MKRLGSTGFGSARVQLAIGGVGVAIGAVIALTFSAGAQDASHDEGSEVPPSAEEVAEAQEIVNTNADACTLYLQSLDGGAESDFEMPTTLDGFDESPIGYRCRSNNLTSEIVLWFVFERGEVVITNSDDYMVDIADSLGETRDDDAPLRAIDLGVYVGGSVKTATGSVTSPAALIAEVSR